MISWFLIALFMYNSKNTLVQWFGGWTAFITIAALFIRAGAPEFAALCVLLVALIWIVLELVFTYRFYIKNGYFKER